MRQAILCRFVFLVFIDALAISTTSIAEDKKSFADTAYKVMEAQIRQEWDRSVEYARRERERGAKAGEHPLSAQEQQDGIDGIKSLLYNRAVIFALCDEEAVHTAKNEQEALAAAGQCREARLSEIGKFVKLTDYLGTIGSRKATTCEMKSRDYKSEFRFLPYEFLRSSRGPNLFDFKAFNECILTNTDLNQRNGGHKGAAAHTSG